MGPPFFVVVTSKAVKRLGLIGGTTYHSTIDYYRLINELIAERLGGLNSAELVLVSVNFADIDRNLKSDDLEANRDIFVDAALRLHDAGAEGLVLCANTMHLDADAVEKASGLPVINVIDAVASVVLAKEITTAALLGTKLTMELDFYRGRLEKHGLTVLTPGDDDRDYIHSTIFGDLGKGILSDEMRSRYVSIISGLTEKGAQGAILGCTEIPMLISDKDVPIPTFDTVRIHAKAAVDFALS